jgi:TolB-like protein
MKFIIGLSIIFIFIFCQVITAQPYRVVVVPFTINMEADTLNLKDGIYTILSSRLSKNDTIIIINREETEKACEEFKNFYGNNRALMIGAKLQADYVVYGSVTVSGENISVLAKLIDISGKKPSISFSKHIQEINEVIPQVNLFASELHEQDFTRRVETEKTGDTTQFQPVDTLSVAEADSLKDTTDTATVPKAAIADSTTRKSDQAVSSPIDSTYFSKKFWKSRTYPILIIGIATGDVNNDGKVETIVIKWSRCIGALIKK